MMKKQEDNAKLWGEALGIGAIENGDSMLISGGTLYGELRPSTDGTYSYISNENTTAVNLIHLDSALNALGVEMLVDSNGNSIQYTSTLYKYFKVDPETTTNEKGTKTYAPDAEVNGTNSVAIGPNAKTATYTTTVTSGDTTTTTETAADHAVAIGDGATVNAAGDKGIALGNGATINKTATGSIAIGKKAVTGGADKPITLTMNDGSTATISGLKDDYITSVVVGTENNHVTMTRLGGDTVDLNLNPILEKYSLSDYHLVGAGTTHDQAYAVDSDGTVTLNVVDDKKPTGTPKTIQITGLASQSGVNAGRTTVTSSDNSVTVSDSAPNSDTHTYDIKVNYSKIPANLTVQYSGDNGITGSNTMDKATAFSGKANQIVTTAENGKVSFKLADDISGIQSVTTGDAKLNTNGLTVTNGPTFTKSNIDANNQQIHKVLAGTENTDAANVSQVKAATTEVKAGTNTTIDAPTKDSTDNHQVYTVNVDNLALSQNDAKVGTGVALKNGLPLNDGTNTTASVGEGGVVSFGLKSEIFLTKVTTGNTTTDTNGLAISGGPTIAAGGINAGGKTITGVANGVGDNDAVNISQLKAVQSDINAGWTIKGKDTGNTQAGQGWRDCHL